MVWDKDYEPFIPIVDAVAVQQPKISGRNLPLEIHCQTNDGLNGYIVKLWNTPELALGVHSLAREVYGSLLADFFGLNTPNIAFVNIDPDFWPGIPDATIRERLRLSPGLNFGSKYLPGATIFKPPVTPAKVHNAAMVFCFDMLVGNTDRNEIKPNMFDSAIGYIVFDHELAFPYSKPELFIGRFPPPWEFIKEGWYKNHILHAGLRGRECALEIEEFVGILEALSDEFLAKIEEKIPTDWNTPDLPNISSYLANARDQAPLFKRSLQEILV